MIKLIILTIIICLIPHPAVSCSNQDIPVTSFVEMMAPVARVKMVSGDNLNIVNSLLSIESDEGEIEYDKLIFVIKSGKDKVMVMTVVKECVTNGSIIPLENYNQIFAEIEGI